MIGWNYRGISSSPMPCSKEFTFSDDGQQSSCVIREQDGRYPLSQALDLCNWCVQRSITLHAEHLPGQQNVTADFVVVGRVSISLRTHVFESI